MRIKLLILLAITVFSFDLVAQTEGTALRLEGGPATVPDDAKDFGSGYTRIGLVIVVDNPKGERGEFDFSVGQRFDSRTLASFLARYIHENGMFLGADFNVDMNIASSTGHIGYFLERPDEGIEVKFLGKFGGASLRDAGAVGYDIAMGGEIQARLRLWEGNADGRATLIAETDALWITNSKESNFFDKISDEVRNISSPKKMGSAQSLRAGIEFQPQDSWNLFVIYNHDLIRGYTAEEVSQEEVTDEYYRDTLNRGLQNLNNRWLTIGLSVPVGEEE